MDYYDAGAIDVFDGTSERTLSAQRDLAVTVGLAGARGPLSFGVSGKCLSSELIETYRATAFAADVGAVYAAGPRFRVGASVQNVGTGVKYLSETDPLPRTARVGAAIAPFRRFSGAQFLIETPYFLNERELRPSVGIEVRISPLSLRAGYRAGSQPERYTLGAGFLIGRMSLDYAVGLVSQLDSRHKISVNFHLGRSGGGADLASRPPQTHADARWR